MTTLFGSIVNESINIDKELHTTLVHVFNELHARIRLMTTNRQIPPAVVRSNMLFSALVLVDDQNATLCGQNHFGMPTVWWFRTNGRIVSATQVIAFARDHLGLDDTFMISIPLALVTVEADERQSYLDQIATAHIEDELRRKRRMANFIRIQPVFGDSAYALNPGLAFVLMPFQPSLTQIYSQIIKPTLEGPELNFVCRRADDVKSNRSIMQDIWQSICESRLVIADLTGFNRNVMYELGIAHTVGKDTVLIYQTKEGADVKFPFDLHHIRRIEYTDDAVGGQRLRDDIVATIKHIKSNWTMKA
jgi:hypothetical protein